VAQPLIASLPADLDLDGGYTIRITALSPTTGAVVAGVLISAAVIMAGDLVGGAPADLEVGDWVLVPGPE
jgi:heme A synthase